MPPTMKPNSEMNRSLSVAFKYSGSNPIDRAVRTGAVITMEYRVGRLNLEVADGTVRRCWKG